MSPNPKTRTIAVRVTTAVAMDDALRAEVSAKVAELFGDDVEIGESIDPNILGGIVLESSEQRFDASVRAQLAAVRQSLSAAFAGDGC